MPCIFCLAVFTLLAGALTTAVLDQMEARLTAVATEPVIRTADSESVLTLRTAVLLPTAGRRSIPVNVTVYKKHRRVRIQVLTHDITRADAETVENLIADALELSIVNRSDAHDERKVGEAFGPAAPDAEPVLMQRPAQRDPLTERSAPRVPRTPR